MMFCQSHLKGGLLTDHDDGSLECGGLWVSNFVGRQTG